MSRSQPTGASALPAPTGDADALRAAATRVRRVAAASAATDVVGGDVAPSLEAIWGGTAASAAISEATVLAARARAFIENLPAASVALERYADAVAGAAGVVRLLQRRWDAALDEHRAALRAAHAHAALDPTHHAHVVARLDQEHRAVLGGLVARHEACLAELSRAGTRCAAAIQTTSLSMVPEARGTRAADLRGQLIGGLAMAEGAARALEVRDRALVAAAEWRLLRPDASPADVERWVGSHGSLAHDPLFAQAFIEEVGVEPALRLITAIAQPGHPASLDTIRELLTTMGAIIFTACAPGVPTDADARTRRQLVLGADASRRDVVASMGSVFATPDGHTRHTGYWLIGQLLVGARQGGQTQPLPEALLKDLAAAAAAAEIAETRDSEIERRHGTTLRRGRNLFASWFDDPDQTGDTLHQLLNASADPATHRAVLAAKVPTPSLENARGDDLVVAEHLVRRWITYSLNGPGEPPDVALATGSDLLRILPGALGDGTQSSSALRARIMAELSRTNAFARMEYSSIKAYERESSSLESATLPWLLAMRESVDQTLLASSTESAATYSRVVSGEHQPRLLREELTGLVGSYAVGTDFGLGGKAPTETFGELLNAELDDLRQTAAAGSEVEPAVTRIAYYNQVASSALVQLATQQDELSQRGWQLLAEAKNILWVSRKDPLGVAESLVTNGTTRTPVDDLVISVVRSDVVARQAEANDARDAELAAIVDDIVRPAASCPAFPATDLLSRGAALAPDTPSAAEAREDRYGEIGHNLRGVLEDLLPSGPPEGDTGRRVG
ncbi:MAG TPA: hypothetical protein VFT81_00060 [Dermatophilaceae bacterium]|nr:hypothetical protein [Dermatophilaceae bacterium]